MSLALWRCMRCGECCKHLIGKKFGAALLPQEKQRLEALARKRALNAEFVPLATNGFAVTLWQFAQEVCPFLDKKKNHCIIYEWRPLLCRMYPLHASGLGSCPSLKHLTNRGYRVVWPPQMLNSGTQFVAMVMPRIRTAVKRYNLSLGRWESNRPFIVGTVLANPVL